MTKSQNDFFEAIEGTQRRDCCTKLKASYSSPKQHMIYEVLPFCRLLLHHIEDVDGANLHRGHAEILD